MSRSIDNSRSVLVTGAAGFVGSCVVRQLLTLGFHVVGIDNLNDYYSPNLKLDRLVEFERSPSFTFEKLDIEDRVALAKLFEEHSFGAVVNLAARAGVRASIENPHAYFTTNTIGTLNLLELMRTHAVSKIVQASTSSLYAGQPMPFVETMPVNQPISPYAASQQAAEVLGYTYHKLFEIDVSVVRYFTVYGPSGRPDMSPYRFFNWIHEGKPIQLYGNGKQERDFTFVDCVARGTIAALKPVGYEIFNIGSNSPTSVLQMIEMMESLVGKKAVIDFLPAHPTDMAATWANTEKTERMLGWQAEVDFAEGLRRTWEWHRSYFANKTTAKQDEST